MKARYLTMAFLAGCATTALAATALLPSQDPADMQDFEKQLAEAMEKYGVPAKEHEMLAERVGSWECDLKFWMVPGMPPQSAVGESNMHMIMDGRYLFEEFTCEFGGEEFEGGGLIGFDRITQEYASIWVDNMGTGMSYMTGKATGDIWEYKGKVSDPMKGKPVMKRAVERRISEDKFIMEMYKPGPDGKEFKSMEITYTRAN